MKVFVTGATGWIGSALTKDLLEGGHQVLGFARDAGKAKTIEAMGAEVLMGDMNDLAALRKGAEVADAVAHLAFQHNFDDFATAAKADVAAINALGEALAGSNRRLIAASGTMLLVRKGDAHGTEDDNSAPGFPRQSEQAVRDLTKRGVSGIAIRFSPTVHGRGDKGFLPTIIQIARDRGEAVYVGEGKNRWPAVHLTDAAHLCRLALEKGEADRAYHAVAETGIPMREIAELISRKLGVPAVSITQEDAKQFGFIGRFIGADAPATAEISKDKLGWQPTGPGLLQDLEEHYF